MIRVTLTAVVAALLAALVPACGYRAGLAPSIDGVSRADTIGVAMFGNESLLPNLERELHQFASDSARRYLDMDLVSPDRADLVLRGSIQGFGRQEGARSGDNLTLETRNTITVEGELVDRRSGEVVGRTSFDTSVGVVIDVPGREPEQRSRALAIAADRLVLELVAGVEYGVTRPGDR